MDKSTSQLSWRNIVLLLLLIGFTILVVTRFTNLRNLITTLIDGNLTWVTIGVLIHILYFYLDAVLHKYSFATVGLRNRATELFPVLLSAFFVNAVAPTGGAGGAAIFVDYNTRQGKSGSKTAAGLVLALISDLSTLIPFILGGVAFLYSRRKLRIIETIGFVFFIIFILLLTGILVMGGRKPELLRRFAHWFQRSVNKIGTWFGRDNWLNEGWADKNASDFISGAKAIATHPIQLAQTLTWGMILHIVNVIGLYVFFLAYDQPVDIGTLVAGFGLGIVFFIVTVIPQGVGAVEWVMTSVFISMGIPQTKAAVIAVVFRGVNFWMPLIAGFFFLRKVSSHSQEFLGKASQATTDDTNPGEKSKDKLSKVDEK